MPSGLKPAIIIDSGIMRGTGKPRNNKQTYRQIRRAVKSENQTLYLPATMYEELGGDPQTIPSGSDWVDPLINEGWVDVAPEISGDPEASYSSPTTERGKLRHAVEHAILQEKKGAGREWEDTALAGLADQILSNAQAARVIIHTTDQPAQKGINRVLAAKWSGHVRTYFHHPMSRRLGSETRSTSAGSSVDNRLLTDTRVIFSKSNARDTPS